MISGKQLYHMPVQLLVSKFLAAPSSEVIETFYGGFGVGPETRLTPLVRILNIINIALVINMP